jgi:hypothetical protein
MLEDEIEEKLVDNEEIARKILSIKDKPEKE